MRRISVHLARRAAVRQPRVRILTRHLKDFLLIERTQYKAMKKQCSISVSVCLEIVVLRFIARWLKMLGIKRKISENVERNVAGTLSSWAIL